MRREKVPALAGALLALAAAPVFAQAPAGNDAGRALYTKNCEQCHGEAGDGKGEAAAHLMPKPRDFTSGKFKIRTTPNGALPTDDDLESIIRRGMPYTSMPAWPQLTEGEVQALVAYVKSFNAGFKEQAAKPVEQPAAPAFSKDSADKGRKIYASLGCASCHGAQGRGDGPSSPSLKDDSGHPIRPANLSEPWTFRGGARREDVFRTLSTGLNGTPMPSFQDALKTEERWQLTDYIASLGGSETPNYSTIVVASPVEDEIDVTKTATSLFDRAPAARFPIVGQVMEPGREFHPPVTSLVVRAIYDQRKIAFLVSWDDTHADTTGKNAPDLQVPPAEEEEEAAPAAGGGDFWGESAAAAPSPSAAPAGSGDFWGEGAGEAPAAAPAGNELSDAVAVQLPTTIPPGAQKPYFLFGDASNPVDLWFLDLSGKANRVRQLVGRGSGSITPLEGTEVEGTAKYENGTWSAIFVRDLRSTTGVSFAEDQFVPVAFSVWDGMAKERGNRRGLTQWMYVYLPPRERPSAVVPMARAAGLTVLVELAIVLGLRRRRRTQAARAV